MVEKTKSFFERDLPEKISRFLFGWKKESTASRFAWLTVAIVCASLVMNYCFTTLPIPCTLKLGIFSTSNWNVPQSETYVQIDALIERFEEANPGVYVEYVSGIIKKDYSDWLNDQIVRGECPDVFLILDDDFNLLSETGALMNLDCFLDADGIDPGTLIFENALQAGNYKGVQYALPLECNLDLMFVNIDLLKQADIPLPQQDWTIDDLLAICEKITADTDEDKIVDQFGLSNYDWQNMIEASDLELFDANGARINLNDEIFSHLIETYTLLQKYTASSYLAGETKSFDSGSVAFSPLSFAEYQTYQPYPWKLKKYSTFNWTALPMPSMTRDGKRGTLNTLLMGISGSTRRPREAWKLLSSFVLDEQSQEDLMQVSSGFSPLKNVTRTMEVETPDSFSVNHLEWSIERSKKSPKFKKFEHAMSLLDGAINQIIRVNEDERQLLLLECQKDINNYLEE